MMILSGIFYGNLASEIYGDWSNVWKIVWRMIMLSGIFYGNLSSEILYWDWFNVWKIVWRMMILSGIFYGNLSSEIYGIDLMCERLCGEWWYWVEYFMGTYRVKYYMEIYLLSEILNGDLSDEWNSLCVETGGTE